MDVRRVALGVIQARGRTVVDPSLVTFGADEADFLARHVGKVRSIRETTVRSRFRRESAVPSLLERFLTMSSEQFEQCAKSLQDSLVAAMATSTNASDCVFAVVHTADQSDDPGYVTLLKLDAVVEAARMSIRTGKVTLTVLKELLPEPGKLQKAVSWPDARAVSDAIAIDKNASHAKYFHAAFDLEVSARPLEAEAELTRTILEHVPPERQQHAMSMAIDFAGPLDDILFSLSEKGFPELEAPARAINENGQPPGMVRTKRAVAKPLVWRADGIEVRVPPTQMDKVVVEPTPDNSGWRIVVTTQAQPEMGL